MHYLAPVGGEPYPLVGKSKQSNNTVLETEQSYSTAPALTHDREVLTSLFTNHHDDPKHLTLILEHFLTRYPLPYFLVHLASLRTEMQADALALEMYREAQYILYTQGIKDAVLDKVIEEYTPVVKKKAEEGLISGTTGPFYQPYLPTRSHKFPLILPHPPPQHSEIQDEWLRKCRCWCRCHFRDPEAGRFEDMYVRKMAIDTNQLEGVFLLEGESAKSIIQHGLPPSRSCSSQPKPNDNTNTIHLAPESPIQDPELTRGILEDTIEAFRLLIPLAKDGIPSSPSPSRSHSRSRSRLSSPSPSPSPSRSRSPGSRSPSRLSPPPSSSYPYPSDTNTNAANPNTNMDGNGTLKVDADADTDADVDAETQTLTPEAVCRIHERLTRTMRFIPVPANSSSSSSVSSSSSTSSSRSTSSGRSASGNSSGSGSAPSSAASSVPHTPLPLPLLLSTAFLSSYFASPYGSDTESTEKEKDEVKEAKEAKEANSEPEFNFKPLDKGSGGDGYGGDSSFPSNAHAHSHSHSRSLHSSQRYIDTSPGHTRSQTLKSGTVVVVEPFTSTSSSTSSGTVSASGAVSRSASPYPAGSASLASSLSAGMGGFGPGRGSGTTTTTTTTWGDGSSLVGVPDNANGSAKRGGKGTGTYTYTLQSCPYPSVDSELEYICLMGRQFIKTWWRNPFGTASWLHLVLVRLGGFEIGNGPLARLIASIPLIRYGYPPIVIPIPCGSSSVSSSQSSAPAGSESGSKSGDGDASTSTSPSPSKEKKCSTGGSLDLRKEYYSAINDSWNGDHKNFISCILHGMRGVLDELDLDFEAQPHEVCDCDED
ncbi:hypothetical protein D9758_004317 [Tetrapyrgos nigripes]|uniref:Uncharacterized protein n=1 Tax=Tetrapyrgos nigripes TaxID=182062 RepID=A0A8H5LVN3_9AGAR|nr:hypothetical protein D9758_004317 [Tetrapyrgos nigripes]